MAKSHSKKASHSVSGRKKAASHKKFSAKQHPRNKLGQFIRKSSAKKTARSR